jgi:hypothetical protein
LKPKTEHPRSHLRSVALTSSSLKDLAAVCILTRPFRLHGHEFNQKMHIYIISKRDVSIAAMINLGAQSCLHVSLILLRSTQLSGTCREMPLRGPRCLGPHLTGDGCIVIGRWSSRAVRSLKTKAITSDITGPGSCPTYFYQDRIATLSA